METEGILTFKGRVVIPRQHRGQVIEDQHAATLIEHPLNSLSPHSWRSGPEVSRVQSSRSAAHFFPQVDHQRRVWKIVILMTLLPVDSLISEDRRSPDTP